MKPKTFNQVFKVMKQMTLDNHHTVMNHAQNEGMTPDQYKHAARSLAAGLFISINEVGMDDVPADDRRLDLINNLEEFVHVVTQAFDQYLEIEKSESSEKNTLTAVSDSNEIATQREAQNND